MSSNANIFQLFVYPEIFSCHILYLKGQIKVLEERYGKVLEMLRKEDKDIFIEMLEQEDTGGDTVYLQACRRGKDKILNTLIQQDEADSQAIDGSGRNGLMWACHEGHIPVVNLLLELTGERAVNVNQRDNYNSTAFTFACELGRLDVVNRLLELKGRVDILATDNDGDNAFMCACIGKSNQSLMKLYF